ncbi:MAG TPA: DUF6125 family protein [Spirochaetota bacterium]|jgi:hypothetical protein|nr:DUF6125 family protein [Spirochaetota bacterium]HNU92560.1 DUF6125 family protein [Spirochaetota bacterium]HPI15829.1 DUF6125 family protein [Spirochaetota bacterium]HPO44601.1 DUF6125 family protein [Spirochaetota bacterium]HPV98072.1 DUF6125 family protein [Spirochaetota bacterium]
MKTYEEMSRDELRELLNRSWMTHDAMWFYHCVQAIGIEKTNPINRAAVKSMAQVEAKRIKKAIGFGEIKEFEHLRNFIENGFKILRGEFMKFELSFPEKNRMHWENPRCFAYEGVKALGLIDAYECGIFDRACGWFEALGVPYEMKPAVRGCLMHFEGKCSVDFLFNFP